MIRLVLLVLVIALPARAEEIVLGLSRNQVAITATFDGSDVLIFGAVKRDMPAPDTGDLGVIVSLAGPQTPLVVRRKERRLGIWINTDAFEFEYAPSFYAIATSGPIEEILTSETDQENRITVPQMIGYLEADAGESAAFTDALIRIRAEEELYQVLEGAVDVEEDTLFRTSITLPANLTEGDYAARIFLTRDGEIVDEYITAIPVQKVGLERWLYNLAHENALVYGLMSLSIAIAAGWGASAAFGLLRR